MVRKRLCSALASFRLRGTGAGAAADLSGSWMGVFTFWRTPWNARQNHDGFHGRLTLAWGLAERDRIILPGPRGVGHGSVLNLARIGGQTLGYRAR